MPRRRSVKPVKKAVKTRKYTRKPKKLGMWAYFIKLFWSK